MPRCAANALSARVLYDYSVKLYLYFCLRESNANCLSFGISACFVSNSINYRLTKAISNLLGSLPRNGFSKKKNTTQSESGRIRESEPPRADEARAKMKCSVPHVLCISASGNTRGSDSIELAKRKAPRDARDSEYGNLNPHVRMK